MEQEDTMPTSETLVISLPPEDMHLVREASHRGRHRTVNAYAAQAVLRDARARLGLEEETRDAETRGIDAS